MKNLLDRRVTIRTATAESIRGTVLEVREDAIDLEVVAGVLRTVRIAMIVDVSPEPGEPPPEHDAYPRARRKLFEAEEAALHRRPAADPAREAAELFRLVRAGFPGHRGVAARLQRAHFLATGRHDFETLPEVVSGDVDDPDYAAAQACRAKLEKARRARRPVGEIEVLVRDLRDAAARALARYPSHRELRQWSISR